MKENDPRFAERSEFRAAIGKRIEKLRVEQRLSQRELAVRAGLTQQEVSYFERGLRSPRVDNLLSLSRTLGVSTDYLLTGEETISVGYQELDSEIASLDSEQRKLLIAAARLFIEAMNRPHAMRETEEEK
ncbi:MAG: helix-turn-helix transcriptional regulator [Clostridia bacterium]|nr:helix-turn-helix transcriptional regulator [Clostridia bacterium]